MIGEIVKGKSFKGCVSYVMEKQDAKLLASDGVLEVDTKYHQQLLYAELIEH